jgi:beta-aspartyl-dipeptidase (metallo-type)
MLKLGAKGRLQEGLDADIVLLDKQFKIQTVLARGALVVDAGAPVRFGTFENRA